VALDSVLTTDGRLNFVVADDAVLRPSDVSEQPLYRTMISDASASRQTPVGPSSETPAPGGAIAAGNPPSETIAGQAWDKVTWARTPHWTPQIMYGTRWSPGVYEEPPEELVWDKVVRAPRQPAQSWSQQRQVSQPIYGLTPS
jgi:hypothetical protein